MALHFDLTGIADFDNVCFEPDGKDRRMKPRSDSLIWASMFVGIDKITEKNYQEFYTRLSIHERLFGAMLRKASVPEEVNVAVTHTDLPCTLEEVRQHIGLSTNAERMTDLQFGKRLMRRLRREAGERAR